MPTDRLTDVKSLVADVLQLDLQDVGDDAALDRTPGWDSLQQLSIMMAAQEEFGRTFSPDELASLTSVKLIAQAVADAKKSDGKP